MEENNFEERERQLASRELNLLARETLAQRGLDAALLPLINLSDRDSCLSSISALETSLNAEVSRRLRKSGMSLPMAAQDVDEDSMSDSEYYAYMRINERK